MIVLRVMRQGPFRAERDCSRSWVCTVRVQTDDAPRTRQLRRCGPAPRPLIRSRALRPTSISSISVSCAPNARAAFGTYTPTKCHLLALFQTLGLSFLRQNQRAIEKPPSSRPGDGRTIPPDRTSVPAELHAHCSGFSSLTLCATSLATRKGIVTPFKHATVRE